MQKPEQDIDAQQADWQWRVNTAKHMGASPDEAQDVVQQAWEKVLRAYPNDTVTQRNTLNKAIKRIIQDRQRAARIHWRHGDSGSLEATEQRLGQKNHRLLGSSQRNAEPPEETALANELYAEISTSASISASKQAVLPLMVAGLHGSEIAKLLQKKRGPVNATIQRIRNDTRDLLKK